MQRFSKIADYGAETLVPLIVPRQLRCGSIYLFPYIYVW